MKKLTLILLLFTAQFSFGQYSGEATIVIENSQADIVKNPDNSGDVRFTVDGIAVNQYADLHQELESKPEISNVQLQNGVWKMHIEPGTPKKVILSHFINYGFKFINIDGETDDILGYLSSH